MATATFRVHLVNPGQVFACLGFLEAADTLCGPAEGGFDWLDGGPEAAFCLQIEGDENPVAKVLGFLAGATAKSRGAEERQPFPAPQVKVKPAAYPVVLTNREPKVMLSHWADGSSRNALKLYAGNRSAETIAGHMLQLIRGLWDGHQRSQELLEDPFLTCPMGGSFNFDARGAWNALDVGYSPNEHPVSGDGGGNFTVWASPVVELLAAWGLEHARPVVTDGNGQVRYAVWRGLLPPCLARAALGCGLGDVLGAGGVRCFASDFL